MIINTPFYALYIRPIQSLSSKLAWNIVGLPSSEVITPEFYVIGSILVHRFHKTSICYAGADNFVSMIQSLNSKV